MRHAHITESKTHVLDSDDWNALTSVLDLWTHYLSFSFRSYQLVCQFNSVFSIVVRRNIFWFFIYHFLSRFFSIVLFLILFFCYPLRLLDLFLRPLCTPPHAFTDIEIRVKLTLHHDPERHSSLIWGVVWPSYIVGISSSGAANLLVSCGLAIKKSSGA